MANRLHTACRELSRGVRTAYLAETELGRKVRAAALVLAGARIRKTGGQVRQNEGSESAL